MPKIQAIKSKGAVLITGSAKRVGKAIALYLSNLGYCVAIHYNHSAQEAQSLASAIRKINGECETFQADLTNTKSVNQLIPKVYKKFHNLQFLVNNASIFEHSNVKSADLIDFDHELAINLRAPFVLTSQFAKTVSSGSIINILDTNISKNKTSYLSYLLTKKSLADLTRLTAVELAPEIRVNAVAPGLILAPTHENNYYLNRLAKSIPLKRKGEPSDIAKAVQFLLENTYITGQTIFVDGGEHLL